MSEPSHQASLLVLGLGNPILSDDAVGLEAARLARHLWAQRGVEPTVTFKQRCCGGLDLLFEVEGYESLIVVDAFRRYDQPAGGVRVLRQMSEMGAAELPPSPVFHYLSLPAALQLGHDLGWCIPKHVAAVVIDVGGAGLVFGEGLSAEVQAALPTAASCVCDLADEFLTLGAG